MHQQRNLGARLLEKTEKKRASAPKVIPVISRMQSVSTNRSVTTVPKDFAKETLSYWASTPQRETSPTGAVPDWWHKIRKKWHRHNRLFWDEHQLAPKSAPTPAS